MKHIRTICLAMALFTSLSGFALTATTNGVTWTYTVSGGAATITGSSRKYGAIEIPSKLGGYNVRCIGIEVFRKSDLTSVTIPDSVTHINTNAFRECYSLSSVTLGNGIETIDNAAFKDCSSLATVTLPESLQLIHNYVFANCTRLTEIEIPNKVARIRPHAFEGCTGLKRVTLGTGINNIGEQCFKNCSSLESVTFEGNAPNRVGDYVFSGVASDFCVYVSRGSTGWGVTIPGTWQNVPISYLSYKVRFNANGGTCATTSLDVERGRSIGTLPVPTRNSGESGTFLGWFTAGGEEVTENTVVNADMTIYAHWSPIWRYSVVDGKAAVVGYSLSEGALMIPTEIDGYPVVAVAANAFNNCQGLTSVTIPNCVTNIGAYAFSGCSGMESFVVGEGHPAFCSVNGMLLSKDGKILVRGVNGDVSIPDGVMKIDDCAFDGRSGLTGVTIPNSVTNIGHRSFRNCNSLTSVTIPNGVTCIGNYTFYGCNGLANMIIPDGVTLIGNSAFSECISLTRVVIPNSVTNIGTSAFSGSSGITSVEIPQCVCDGRLSLTFPSYTSITNVVICDDVTSIGGYAFYDCKMLRGLTIPDGLTSIGGYAFGNCIGLTNVAIPNSVTNIGNYAFYGCSGLTSVTIPNGIADIGAYMFYGCSGLTNVTIPDSVTSIGGYAFRDCSALSSVRIPSGVTSIGSYAFSGCSGLTDVTIPDGVTNIWNNAFEGCSGIVNVNIPDGVMSIGDNAFYGCSSIVSIEISQYVCARQLSSAFPSSYQAIESVKISDSVTSIGNSVFDGCSGIKSVTIPQCVCDNQLSSVFPSAYQSITNVVISDSVTRINASAFSGCTGIRCLTVEEGNTAYCVENGLLLSKDGTMLYRSIYGDVVIPDGVTSIGDYAFEGHSDLTHVTIPNKVTNIGAYAFYECSELTGVAIPDSVKSIGSYAFYNCTNLVGALTIPDGVTRIEDFTFYNCRGLTSVTIPNTVTSIGASAFRGCKGFTGIMTIPPSVTSIGAAAFYGCSNLKGVNIEDVAAWCNITFVGSFANPLRYARNLYIDDSPITDLTVPDSVTNIGSNSFYNCTNLLSLTVPNGITRMGAYSFYGCSGLTNVTVSESVAAIDTYAFYNCNRLARMMFSGNAPVIGSSVFLNGSPCTAYVRRASTGWGVTIPGRWNGIAIDYVHYAVTMDANGGTCETASLDVREGYSVGALPEPTWGNAVFLGWFTEVEGGEWVDESFIVTEPTMLHAHWLTEVARPVIVSDLGAVFRADSCKVSITSETEGATIYYTDDGTTPKRYDDYLYAGPVTITDTTTFKAVAVVGGLRSAYTTVTITKHNLTLGEALNVGEGVALATNPVLPWQPIYDLHAKLGDATARSGVIGNRTNTWLSATVSGAGTMTFWCKVSCEHDEVNNLFICDRLMVYTNDVEITDWRMDGETGWTQRELTFEGGENTVKWVYYKDKSDSAGEDCAWVDGITWTSSGADAGLAAWLAERNLTVDAQAANGRTAAECYALGLDPALATNDFRIVSIEMVNGKPKVEWEPKTNRWTGAEIQAVLKGAATLDGEWQTVTEESKAGFRFFKVVVELP